MARSFGILVLGLCLTGCMTNKVDDRLGRLVGHDVHEIVVAFGPPNGQPKIEGDDKVYTWTTSGNIQIESEQIGGLSDGSAGFNGSSSRPLSYVQSETAHLEGTMQLTTDQNDRIKSYKWSANRYCQQYYAWALYWALNPSMTLCKIDSSPRMGGICD